MNFRNFGVIITILVIALLTAGIFSSGCYMGDDETRVTIRLQRNDLGMNNYIPEKRMIDRVLEFFSTRAEAVTAQLWSDVKGDMSLVVSSSSFQDKTYTIPAAATTYSVIVPAVSNVTFTLIAVDGGKKNWGGHTTVSLVPGEVELFIKMIPMVAFFYQEGNILHFYNFYNGDGTPPPTPNNVDGFYIYRAVDIDGQYERIAILPETDSTFTDSDPLEIGSTYYYKISVFGSDGEGVLSESISVLYNPT